MEIEDPPEVRSRRKPLLLPGPRALTGWVLAMSVAVGLQWSVRKYKLLPTVLVLSMVMPILALVGVPTAVLIIRWRTLPTEDVGIRKGPPNFMELSWLPHLVSAMAFLVVGCMNLLLSMFLAEIDFLKLSVTIQVLAFALPAMRALMTGRVSVGMSARKLFMDVVWLACRIASTAMVGKRLPKKSGEGLALYANGACLCLALLLLGLACRQRGVRRGDSDVSRIWFPAAFALALAAVQPATLSRRYFPDALWTLSMYLDACSIYPQLRMIAQSGNVVEEDVSHHLAGLFFSRLFALTFWWCVRGSWLQGLKITGVGILLVHVLQLLSLSRFMSFYFRACWSRGLFSGVPILCADA